MSDDLLFTLRCPITRQPLSVAQKCECPHPHDEGLITRDGRVFYPVRNNIPLLISSEAIRTGAAE